MKIFFKNLFDYRLNISRTGFLLIIIWIFLTFISFIKGIQILIFIPAFVLSIFIYSFIEYLFIKKNIKYELNIWKNWNLLKIFSKNNKKYNYILAYKDKNKVINFMTPNKDLSYDLKENNIYDLYLYVYGKFDIIRKVLPIWIYNFTKDIEKDNYTIIKKYESDDELKRIDSLKSSIYDSPYIKKEEDLNFLSKNDFKLKILSNNDLELKWNQELNFLHILLILVSIIWLVIEWQNMFFNVIIFLSLIWYFIAKRKRIKIDNKKERIIMIWAFLLMIIITIIQRDMSWSWSMFLIQLLLLSLLTKKWAKNSFLFIFLAMFVFVAISLFSVQIRFILLFLIYLFISTYLLFFVSWTENYEDTNYKFWNIIKKSNLLTTFFTIIFLIICLYFILPHWENKTWENLMTKSGESTVSWFNEEISLQNLERIKEDNTKIFVIENIDENEINKLGLKYFKWMRYDEFNWSKWNSKYKETLIPFKQTKTQNETKTLRFNYYLDNSRNLFIPNSILSINNQNWKEFFNILNDKTLIKLNKPIKENLIVDFTFELDKNGKIINNLEKINRYNFKLNNETKNLLKDFIEKIPPEITNSPEKLTDYVKYRAWMKYSIENPSPNLEDFLYWNKLWHCEYFATTLALVLQYYWFEATLVNWFANWEYNQLANSYIFRWKNAHSWVEVYDKEKNVCNIYDATPGDYNFYLNNYNYYVKPVLDFYDYIDIKWYTYIVNYTSLEQKELFLYLLWKINILIFLVFVLVLLYLIFRLVIFVYHFMILNKKEKIMFILSYYLRKNNFALEELPQDFRDKYKNIIYWGESDVSIVKFLRDLRDL